MRAHIVKLLQLPKGANPRQGTAGALAVEPQQVVLGQTEAADGRIGFQATMLPMPIVAMEPVDQFGRSLSGVVIRARVGPFA